MYHWYAFRHFASCLGLWAGAAVVCLFSSLGSAALEKPPPASSDQLVYHTDPGHLWNRLHEALFIRVGPDGRAYGQDRLEPLLWGHSKHLLEDRSHKRGLALLEEFLKHKGEKLIKDPLKRALLQRDLWLVFNWLEGDHSNFAPPPLQPAAARAAQERLRRPLAAVIGRLALSPKEVRDLPDNYAAAVASGRFARRFDAPKPDLPYLPADLFAVDGPWVCVGRSGGLTTPEHLREGRDHRFNNSVFLVFLRLPAGRAATLEYLKRQTRFPKGTEVALVRRALLIDTSHRVVPTALTESVQLRVGDVPAEFRLSRAQLFAGRAGGLRPVGPDERDFKTGFGAHSWDEFEYRFPGGRRFPEESLQPIKRECSACHNSRFPDLRTGAVSAMPVSEVAGAVVKWKEGRPNWTSLRKLLAE